MVVRSSVLNLLIPLVIAGGVALVLTRPKKTGRPALPANYLRGANTSPERGRGILVEIGPDVPDHEAERISQILVDDAQGHQSVYFQLVDVDEPGIAVSAVRAFTPTLLVQEDPMDFDSAYDEAWAAVVQGADEGI